MAPIANFSNPFSTRLACLPVLQPPGMHVHTYSDVSEPFRGRQLAVTSNSEGSSLPVPTGAANLQQPQDQSTFHFFHALTTDYSIMLEEESEVLQTFYISRSSSISSLEQAIPPPKSVKKGRYYSYALSEEDKDALTRGEKNHNLKSYTPKDLIMHHESRKELVPAGAINKLDKVDALAHIERAKKYSQQALGKKVRDTAKLPWFRLVNEDEVDSRLTYQSQAFQSMSNLRSSNTPAPQLPSASPLPLTMSRVFSFDTLPPAPPRSSHIRATSSGDYFSRPIRRQPSRTPLPLSSGTSYRVRSPLATDFSSHHVNPNATFDAFLVPHKSGKGEVVRGTANAKKAKDSMEDVEDPEQENMPVKEKVFPRHIFSRMPSMPSLGKRSSRRDLRMTSLEESEVPPLP
jgi:hypothetical protein